MPVNGREYDGRGVGTIRVEGRVQVDQVYGFRVDAPEYVEIIAGPDRARREVARRLAEQRIFHAGYATSVAPNRAIQRVSAPASGAAHLSRRRPRRAGGSRHGWSPTTRRPSQPSRAPSLPTCSRRQGRPAHVRGTAPAPAASGGRPGASMRPPGSQAGWTRGIKAASMRPRREAPGSLWDARTRPENVETRFNEARREAPGSRTRYRMPHHKQLRSTLRALAQHPETRHYPVSALERSQRRGGARPGVSTTPTPGHHTGALFGVNYAAIMPSRFSLAINSAWLPVPLRRLQEPHRSW